MSKIPFNQLKNTIKLTNHNFFLNETVLSDDNMKKTIQKFGNFKPLKQQTDQSIRKAAVLIPLCLVDNKVSLLYTLRAANLKSHRGQVSFPGGMEDKTDKNLEETALRETYEELGIEPSEFKIWGCGQEISGRGETSILPVIGQLKTELIIDELKINAHEVEEVFAVSLQDLCNPNKIGHTQFRGSYSLPVFTGGKRKIWGLTAVMTYIFLKALLPKEAYNHKVKYVSMTKSYVK